MLFIILISIVFILILILLTKLYINDKFSDKYKPELYCINLDREEEKYKNIQKEFGSMFKINRISAIDGKKIKYQEEMHYIKQMLNFLKI
jgi:hypothetical protein